MAATAAHSSSGESSGAAGLSGLLVAGWAFGFLVCMGWSGEDDERMER